MVEKMRKVIAGLMIAVMVAGLCTGYHLKDNVAEAAENGTVYTANQLLTMFETELVCQALARLGHDYQTGTGYNTEFKPGHTTVGQKYDCSGLVTASLIACGVTHINGKDITTIDWGDEYWCVLLDSDKPVTMKWKYQGKTYDIKFKTSKSYYKSTDNVPVKPGMILAKYDNTENAATNTTGHVTIALGNYSFDTSSVKTAQNVAADLVAKYGTRVAAIRSANGETTTSLATLLAAGSYSYQNLSNSGTKDGKKWTYGHGTGCWDYRTVSPTVSYNGSDFRTKGYVSAWQVDALNSDVGVSVNNDPYGKNMDTVIYRLEFTEDETGNADVYKADDHGNKIPGVKFAMYTAKDVNTQIYGSVVTTDANGLATWDGEELGLAKSTTYYVREVEGVDGYYTTAEWKDVTIVAGTTQHVTTASNPFINKAYSMNVHVTKVEKGTTTVLSACNFVYVEWDATKNAYSTTEHALTYNSTTKKYDTGVVYYTKNNLGKIKVYEKSSDANHVNSGWSKEYVMTAQANEATQEVNVQVENDVQKGTYHVEKKWNDGNLSHTNDTVTVQLYKTVNGTKMTVGGQLFQNAPNAF